MTSTTERNQGSIQSVIDNVKSRISYLERPDGPHRYNKGIHKSIGDCGACQEMWSLKRVVDALDLPEYCGDCDGVGWVEGGASIQTDCGHCGGSGWEPIVWLPDSTI